MTANSNGNGPMDLDERAFWLDVRRGLLLVTGAIEKHLQIGRFEPEEKSMVRTTDNSTHYTTR